MQGASPLASPGLKPNGTCTTKEFCLSTGAVPVAKERGDRGRGTSAFEMVLSPGAGRTSAAGVQPPPGKSALRARVGGMGAGKKSKGRVGGRQEKHAPRRVLGSPPFPSAARVQSRGCKGRSPLHEKNLGPPLPAGKGVGGMGAEKQAKGRVGRRLPPFAPRRVPDWQVEPVPPGFSSPAGDRAAPRRKKVRRRGANFQIPIDREAKRCYNVFTSAKGFFVVSGNLRHKSDTLPSQREVHGPRPGTRRRGQIF